MAFLMRRCTSIISQRPLCEINRLKYYTLTKIKSVLTENKNILSVVQSRHLSTENDVKHDKSKLETVQIYYGPLTKQIRSVKVFTILSSIAGLLSQPMLYNKVQELGLSATTIAMGTFYGFFILVSPLLIHLVTKRYVTHVEYDPRTESYAAYTYTFFVRRKKVEYTPDDVKIPTIPGMFTTIVVKGNPMFMDPRMFDNPKHYSKMMGYDKPIDFSLESDSEEQKK